MSEVKLSFFASAVRPHLWDKLIISLKSNKYKYEIIFSGFIDKEIHEIYTNKYPELKYIQTGDIKPCQCYEIARRSCTGELVCWIADDVEFSEGFVDKVVDYFNSLRFSNHPAFDGVPDRYVISCKTNENDNNETMLNHRFFGRNQNTPLMSPIGVMSREYLNQLGGLDRRYICGQYENDIVMRVLADDGKVHLYEDVCVNIDHKNKHGSETNFWSGYNEDREQLENSWVIGGYKPSPENIFIAPKTPKEWFEYEKDPSKFWYVPINNTEVTLKRNDKHEPFTFTGEKLLTKSESRKGQWQ